MNKYFLLALFSLGLFFSCSDSELLTPGDEFQMPILPGTFTAEIDGVFHDFSETVSVTSNDATTSINGANAEGQTIALSFSDTIEEGTYNQGGGAMIMLVMGGEQGNFVNVGATGQLLSFSLRITELNMADMVVTGVFSGKVRNMVSGEELTVSNGQFKELPFTIEEGGDGILKGKFDGVLLDFSTDAQAQGDLNNAIISGQNAEMQNLKITVPGGLEIGTFTEEDEVIVEVTLGTSDPSEFYTNYDEENDVYLPVSITISDITQDVDGRVIGTFTGTIKKFTGETDEEIEITEGLIDVPIVVGP